MSELVSVLAVIDERLKTMQSSLDGILAEAKLMRLQVQTQGTEIEAIKRHCIERHTKISKEIEKLQKSDGEQTAATVRVDQTWKTVAAAIALIGALAGVLFQIFKNQ